jgi:hypothetical protein
VIVTLSAFKRVIVSGGREVPLELDAGQVRSLDAQAIRAETWATQLATQSSSNSRNRNRPQRHRTRSVRQHSDESRGRLLLSP